ncbi:uncharacterized protein V2V93DRAFT_372402 [Kockiozyma suomiensis]|uniref:uncharacterized protein n=1 Tax=Kockiozyma suomiensis TaxID=1337062 RepID=UPI0033438061
MISSYAFISHSPSTYPHREPEIDNAPLARRKRRRTSPNELQILYSEFKRCSKPPRHVRQDIAERVGMTEKAVQIWFQNRRQSSRRAQQNGGSTLSGNNASSSPPSLSESRSSQISSSPGPESPVTSPLNSSLSYKVPNTETARILPPIQLPIASAGKSPLAPSSASAANVMSMAAITNSAHTESLPLQQATKSSSLVRLAMSVDGKAQVVFDGLKAEKREVSEKENLALSEPAISEYECVQNLLQLRRGTWA